MAKSTLTKKVSGTQNSSSTKVKSKPKKRVKTKANGSKPNKTVRNLYDGTEFTLMLQEFQGPITRFDAAFNPDTGIGLVRIVMNGSEKPFRNLSASDFAALVSILNLPNLRYNGQYVTASN